jgi:Tfp pilus assembly protein PilZ
MKKIKPIRERRQSVRFHVHSLIKYATESQVVTFQVTNIRNASRGGLAVFLSEQEIEGGTVLQLQFLLPNREKPVAARGRVVRCSPVIKNAKAFEVGIQFLDVTEDARLAILELEDLFLESQKKTQP